MTVCIGANTLFAPQAGGHHWVYLNWALGLRALDCRPIWLEWVTPDIPVHQLQGLIGALKSRLEPYGLAEAVAICAWNTAPPFLMESVGEALAMPDPGSEVRPSHGNETASLSNVLGCIAVEEAGQADLLLNLTYEGIPPEVVQLFRRSALVDIDPGLAQIWMSEKKMQVPPHDLYFTIGETVGQPEALFPDCGIEWHYTHPPVFLDAWPVRKAEPPAPYTTVTNWWDKWVEFRGESFENGKRAGFLPFLELPGRTSWPLEVAISLREDEAEERKMLQDRGWRVRHSYEVAGTPWDYQHYIQSSHGEFSCVKPSCVKLQNAWISDRTICYLASGKPAVVQHTGNSRFLPDAAGLFRFCDINEAVRCLETVAEDYDHQCELARALAEEYFDSQKVLGRVLERCLN